MLLVCGLWCNNTFIESIEGGGKRHRSAKHMQINQSLRGPFHLIARRETREFFKNILKGDVKLQMIVT